MSNFSRARQNMVDGQIRPSSVTDWRIIDAMRAIPRELFVPESRRAMAYLDIDLAIGGAGGGHLLNPTVTARLLQAAEIAGADHVLIVGCTTGYVAALAAKLADSVVSTVGDEAQAAQARAALAQVGIGNVTVRVAPAAAGSALDAPFDAIILNGATEIEPTALCEQLNNGGRLVGAFACGKPQRVKVVSRTNSEFGTRVLFDAMVPVLPGLQRTPAFVF